MRRRKSYTVYIMASASGTLYIGVTGNVLQRVWMHKTLKWKGFTSRYRCTKLVYKEHFELVLNAIRREKRLKGWRRDKKLALIEQNNPAMLDLAVGWYEEDPSKVEFDIATSGFRS